MDEDFETLSSRPIRFKKNKDGDDFPSMMTDMFRGVNWKIALFIYILGIFVFSDVFIDNFLLCMPDAVEGDCPTTKGTLIQLLALVMGYMVFDLLVQGSFL